MRLSQQLHLPFLFAAFTRFFTASSLSPTEQQKPKPNILIILGDDIGTGDIPGYWHTNNDKIHTNMPNIQNLIENGVLFEDAHSSPYCAPSRYTLLSGNYPHRGVSRAGTYSLNYDGNQFLSNQKSIAHVLGDAGYHTAMFGKWHLGGKYFCYYFYLCVF